MTLPDITLDCPDAEIDLFAQRAEIGLPSTAGKLNEKHNADLDASRSRALADYAKAAEQLLPDCARRGVYGAVEHQQRSSATTDRMPAAKAEKMTPRRVVAGCVVFSVLAFVGASVVIGAGYLVGCAIDAVAWTLGCAVGSL